MDKVNYRNSFAVKTGMLKPSYQIVYNSTSNDYTNKQINIEHRCNIFLLEYTQGLRWVPSFFSGSGFRNPDHTTLEMDFQ